jgi:hypothetical protein
MSLSSNKVLETSSYFSIRKAEAIILFGKNTNYDFWVASSNTGNKFLNWSKKFMCVLVICVK